MTIITWEPNQKSRLCLNVFNNILKWNFPFDYIVSTVSICLSAILNFYAGYRCALFVIPCSSFPRHSRLQSRLSMTLISQHIYSNIKLNTFPILKSPWHNCSWEDKGDSLETIVVQETSTGQTVRNEICWCQWWTTRSCSGSDYSI